MSLRVQIPSLVVLFLSAACGEAPVDDSSATRVVPIPAAPEIVAHPESLTVRVGQPAVFAVKAEGTGPVRYQWQREEVDLPGETTARLTLPAVAAADDGAHFRCVVSNAGGTVRSDPGTLTVTSGSTPIKVTITQQPAPATVAEGDSVTFRVTARGSAPLKYQWQRGTADIDGATSSVYTFKASVADNGVAFRCVVRNDAGSVESEPATLTVTPVALPELSYARDIHPLWEASCGGCHIGRSAGGLSLSGNSRAALVDVASSCDPLTNLVVASSPGASQLWLKLTDASGKCGGKMPPAGVLPAQTLEKIQRWIQQGAPNN